jgi:NAD-dependent oxidoreductase involved in siderophore biosynthesis
MLACGAKLVAMLIQNIEDDDPFASLYAIQGAIEVFAAQATTPVEKAIAQSMRLMAEELMRRNPNTHHPHGRACRSFIETTQHPVLRFRRARNS